ncbi:MAG: DNA translocase FtsK [Butyricicoccus pullicaecorum]|nr:DNA translocase FtsK [Butyricicoccus pullicaecorum]
MAATKKKSSASRASGQSSTQKKNKSPAKKRNQKKTEITPVVPREMWAVIYGVLGLLCLIAVLKRDGAVLRLIHTTLSGMVGWGIYLCPFALFGIAALLFVRRKGPVRLRSAAIACTPILFGAFIHALLCGPDYTDAGLTMFRLLGDGAKLQAGGLLAGGLYSILRWAFSGIGAMLLLIIGIIADIMVICRLTPGAIWDALRPLEYEYDSDEEREFYEGPVVLPNVHEAVANRRAQRAEKRAAFDIALDDEPDSPEIPELVMQAVPDTEQETEQQEEVTADPPPLDDILALFENRETVMQEDTVQKQETPEAPPWEEETKPRAKQEKTEKISEDEQAVMNAQMDENQKAPLMVYEHPPVDLLNPPKGGAKGNVQAELTENSQRLVDTLESFGIEAKIIGIVRGPSVTRFELTIERGVKFSRITALSDDIALSLGAVSVRIAPIPDKVAIGIEVPNKSTTMVTIREVIGSDTFAQAKSHVAFSVGKDITGAPVVGDIGKMPHLLIAGTTGSGKSVCVNSMLISLLYKSSPEQVRLIMVDPKMVELGNYNGIPHLLIPVVTDPKKAAGALNWAVGEMERRYKLFADNQVRKLEDFNALMRRKKAEAEQMEGGTPEVYQTVPEIVIVIDELADLMMVAAKEVETSICRIAQKARAAGMYLIVATQRPSADVITGIMKANIPSRIAFAVASQIESRIILDQTGAEKLIGKGDMLYAPLGEGKPQRIQGCFISNDEIERVISFVKSNGSAEYSEEILEHIEKQAQNDGGGNAAGEGSGEEDELLMDAIDVVVEGGQASVSMLQRRLKLGYSRAARIVDQMEERGIVGPFEGSKPRQILISKEDWKEMKLRRQS